MSDARRVADLELLQLIAQRGRPAAAAQLGVSRQRLHQRLHGAVQRLGATVPADLVAAALARRPPTPPPASPVAEPPPVALVTWPLSLTDSEYGQLRRRAGWTPGAPLTRGALASVVTRLAEQCSADWPPVPDRLAPWGVGAVKVPLRIAAPALQHLQTVAVARGTTAGRLFRAAVAADENLRLPT